MSNPFVQPRGWSELKLEEIRRVKSGAGKPYAFHTSCVSSDYDSIAAMLESSEECDLSTMEENCDLDAFKTSMMYDTEDGLKLEFDWHVAYATGTYKGRPCYFLTHSAIEYIWVLKETADGA